MSTPMGPVSAEAVARVSYLLERPFGCGVLVGAPRSGKSALLRVLAESCARSGSRTAAVEGQGCDVRSLMWELASQWGLAPAVDDDRRRLTQQVRDYVHGALLSGLRLAILVDHADRLEQNAAHALARLIAEHESRTGLTLLWSADAPLRGDTVELLLRWTELRIECPDVTHAEATRLAKRVWNQSADDVLSDHLAEQIANLGRNDPRRVERLSRLAQLAAQAERTSVDGEMLEALSLELA